MLDCGEYDGDVTFHLPDAPLRYSLDKLYESIGISVRSPRSVNAAAGGALRSWEEYSQRGMETDS